METRKYLKTVEDVLALKDTDTKIYVEGNNSYYKFVNGVLCHFIDDGRMFVHADISLQEERPYILEEPIMQEATEEDIGTLCEFWGRDYKDAELGILEEVSYDDDEVKYLSKEGYWYYHCRRLTPSEVAEITGYKVEEEE